MGGSSLNGWRKRDVKEIKWFDLVGPKAGWAQGRRDGFAIANSKATSVSFLGVTMDTGLLKREAAEEMDNYLLGLTSAVSGVTFHYFRPEWGPLLSGGAYAPKSFVAFPLDRMVHGGDTITVPGDHMAGG